jgi:hypothetical protein
MAALNTVTVVATVVIVFDTAAPSSAVAFEGTLGPLDNYVTGGALAGTVFDGSCPHFLVPQTPSQASLSAQTTSHISQKARHHHHSFFSWQPPHTPQSPAPSEAHRVYRLVRRPYSPDPHLSTFQRTPCAPRGYNGQQRLLRQSTPSPRSHQSSHPGI